MHADPRTGDGPSNPLSSFRPVAPRPWGGGCEFPRASRIRRIWTAQPSFTLPRHLPILVAVPVRRASR